MYFYSDKNATFYFVNFQQNLRYLVDAFNGISRWQRVLRKRDTSSCFGVCESLKRSRPQAVGDYLEEIIDHFLLFFFLEGEGVEKGLGYV